MRRGPRLVYGALDVKAWLADPPSIATVRSGQCPRCGNASRPVGRGLGLWGHGVRRRQVRGPLSADGPPVLVELIVRRSRCRGCRTIVRVVPRGLVACRVCTASAIALAFARFGLERQPLPRVRAAVNPWTTVGATAAAGWLAVRRWVRAVRQRRLFPRVGGFALITGDPGIGKSVVLRLLAARLERLPEVEVGAATSTRAAKWARYPL